MGRLDRGKQLMLVLARRTGWGEHSRGAPLDTWIVAFSEQALPVKPLKTWLPGPPHRFHLQCSGWLPSYCACGTAASGTLWPFSASTLRSALGDEEDAIAAAAGHLGGGECALFPAGVALGETVTVKDREVGRGRCSPPLASAGAAGSALSSRCAV